MAAQQVFDITELLEAILLELPIKDLLFAQKICRRFKAVIEDSTSLQKALFFQPGQIDDAAIDAKHHHFRSSTEAFAVNPLLSYRDRPAQSFPSDYILEVRISYDQSCCGDGGGGGGITITKAHSPSCLKMRLTQPPLPAKTAVSYRVLAKNKDNLPSSDICFHKLEHGAQPLGPLLDDLEQELGFLVRPIYSELKI
jgi:hypothetical protein